MPDHPNPKRLLPVIIAYLHVFSSVDAILKLKLNSISESTYVRRLGYQNFNLVRTVRDWHTQSAFAARGKSERGGGGGT